MRSGGSEAIISCSSNRLSSAMEAFHGLQYRLQFHWLDEMQVEPDGARPRDVVLLTISSDGDQPRGGAAAILSDPLRQLVPVHQRQPEVENADVEILHVDERQYIQPALHY